MSNSTLESANEPSDTTSTDLVMNCVYMVQGLVMACGSLSLVTAVFFYEALRTRKTQMIIAGLCMADGMNGLGYLTAGANRAYRILTNETDLMQESLLCFLHPYMILWGVGEPAAALMMSFMSLDRLIAVSWPLWHHGQGVTYAYSMMVASFGVGAAEFLLIFTYNLPSGFSEKHRVRAMCYVEDITSRFHQIAHIIVIALSVLMSIFILGIVVIIVGFRMNKKKAKSVKPMQSINRSQLAQQKRNAKIQMKMTRSVVSTGVCTIFLFVIPLTIIASHSVGDELLGITVTKQFLEALWLLSNFNSIMNTVIFIVNHKELRTALVALFSGKNLPADLTLWI